MFRVDPLLSVAIASYRGARYITEQLQSIEDQSIHPAKVIISDDNSPDGTADLVETFARTSKLSIEVIRQKSNLGVINNFLCAFENCHTPYIVYCDQDDFWVPGKIEALSQILSRPGKVLPALVYHYSRVTDHELNPGLNLLPGGVNPGNYKAPHIPDVLWGLGHQMMFSQEVLQVLKGLLKTVDPRLEALRSNMDLGLLFAAGMVGDIVLLPKTFTLFRRHDVSVSVAGKDSPTASNPEQRRWSKILEISTILEALETLAPDFLNNNKSVPYLKLTKRLKRVYSQRRFIYEGPSGLIGKLGVFLVLVFTGSYGLVVWNRLPPRTAVLDFMATLWGTKKT